MTHPPDKKREKDTALPLPMTPEEVSACGWDAVDVVFVTGDAYIDHPSFAMALLGRLLESEGFRVAILSQPDWHSCEPWKIFGRPRVCFAISAGNMDSMLNHYTANRKVRNDDAYSPGGEIHRRPDRATMAYCQRAREAFKGVPIVAGGVEASLRRFAHYDYWSDKVRRSILLDAKADLVVYGMGERPLVEIVKRLAAGETMHDLRDLRGVAYRLGAKESEALLDKPAVAPQVEEAEALLDKPAVAPETDEAEALAEPVAPKRDGQTSDLQNIESIVLPSYEEVVADNKAFAAMTRTIFRELNPFNARRLVQFHGREAVVVNPPSFPLDEAEMDRVYGLPYTRQPHPSYGKLKIPAFEVIKNSIQIVRGCFGGCSFCSITAHEGRIIQNRSAESILNEIRRMAEEPGFSGVLSDLGGPTANMYRMNCSKPEVRAACRRLSCLHPEICPLLNTDHGALIELLEAVRREKSVKKAFVASGIRMDLALKSPKYIEQIARHHTGGLLKIAPEHASAGVLDLMHKPPVECYEEFCRQFKKASEKAGKEQYTVAYFIAGHPGSDLDAMIELALYLKQNNLRPEQVQDFIPAPMDIATCMYHTGIDPMSGKSVYVPKGARERRLQRALLQYFMPENYDDVREALLTAKRGDLIGQGPDCLIASSPPKQKSTGTKKYSPKPSTGYRPHRSGAKRRRRNDS